MRIKRHPNSIFYFLQIGITNFDPCMLNSVGRDSQSSNSGHSNSPQLNCVSSNH